MAPRVATVAQKQRAVCPSIAAQRADHVVVNLVVGISIGRRIAVLHLNHQLVQPTTQHVELWKADPTVRARVG
jgi:hypothetical protein